MIELCGTNGGGRIPVGMISKMFEFFVLLSILFFCTVLQYFLKNMHNCDAVYLNVIFNGPIWV